MSGLSTVSRVGVDLDGHGGLAFLVSYLRASRFGVVRAYRTRHGFHVECDLREPCSLGGALDVRRLLGDDPDRLGVDESRVARGADLRRFDTLFVGRLKGGVCSVRREVRPLACGPYPVSQGAGEAGGVESASVGGSSAGGSGGCVA